MQWPKRKKFGSPHQELQVQTAIVVIAPVWLQETLSVLLHGVSNISLLAITVDLQAVLTVYQDRPPEVVLLYGRGPVESICDDVTRLKTIWPKTCCIVLVDNRTHADLVQSAGADQV